MTVNHGVSGSSPEGGAPNLIKAGINYQLFLFKFIFLFMLDFTATTLFATTFHYIGNASNDGPLIINQELLECSATLASKLTQYFTHNFTAEKDQYAFYHPTSLQYNEVYNYAQQVFKDNDSLLNNSQAIATHLYNNATHPNIQAGELHVALLKNILYGNKKVQALVIVKTETRTDFFTTNQPGTAITMNYAAGLDSKRFDKGCIILDTNSKDGYVVYNIDYQNRKEEAKYWIDNFLKLQIVNNNYQQSNAILDITKQFITKQFPEEFKVNKIDQLDLLSRTIDYFKANETFEQTSFEQEVFTHKQTIESFKNYQLEYIKEHELKIDTSFDISDKAVQKNNRVYKSVLKLDKNFSIYIHGDRSMIESGMDSDGRKYYKLYYEEEK
jgi:hypothetical protein